MTRVRFEPTIPAFEWTKEVHAVDSTATVIGMKPTTNLEDQLWKISYLPFGPRRHKES
jgi:hypothetical protein